MSVERINSLIKTYFSDTLMRELERVFYAKSFIEYPKKTFESFKGTFRSKDLGDKVRILILHNNDRINLYKALIHLHWNRPVNFGTGTNRMAVIVDSYVFKIAMDHAGCVDNLHEFIMSSELQPYVTKCYETNELISVSEYVNVISDKGQFENRKDEIMDILRELEAATSLMLDVGFIPKNMTNWGIRPSDDKAVILDYGYLYTDLEGISLTCADQTCIKKFGITRLIYNDVYSHLVCPNCGKEVSVLELQSLITTEARTRMYDSKMKNAFKVNKPVTYFKVDEFGDYVEMEEADDSLLVSKKKRKENIEEVMEKYKEICTEYRAQQIALGEPSDFIQQQKETLRRMVLELKYGIDYIDMDLETKLEEPYEPEELNETRMYDLNDDPLEKFLNRVTDKDIDKDTMYRLREEIEEEDMDEIKSTFMSNNERDKILSKLLIDRGEKPLVELYEDEPDDEEEEEFIPISKEVRQEFSPIYEKKEEPKPQKVGNIDKHYGCLEIELGCDDDDESILDETSKFINSISTGVKTQDALEDTTFEEVSVVSDEVETTDNKTEVTSVILEKPGVEVEATVTNDIHVIKEFSSESAEELTINIDLPDSELKVETDEAIMELDDSMTVLMESDDYSEVISNGAEVFSEEVTFVANSYESENVTELAEEIKELHDNIQGAGTIESTEVISNGAEVDNTVETQEDFSSIDDEFDMYDLCQDLLNQDDDKETFNTDTYIQNVVRSEDEDLVTEPEVISTKHVEEKVKKVEYEKDDDYGFDDDDEFDEIYEQNYRERSMKGNKKSFK